MRAKAIMYNIVTDSEIPMYVIDWQLTTHVIIKAEFIGRVLQHFTCVCVCVKYSSINTWLLQGFLATTNKGKI